MRIFRVCGGKRIRVCTSYVVLSGHMVSGRLIIFNTLLKRLSDRITKGVNVALTENDGFEKPEKVAL